MGGEQKKTPAGTPPAEQTSALKHIQARESQAGGGDIATAPPGGLFLNVLHPQQIPRDRPAGGWGGGGPTRWDRVWGARAAKPALHRPPQVCGCPQDFTGKMLNAQSLRLRKLLGTRVRDTGPGTPVSDKSHGGQVEAAGRHQLVMPVGLWDPTPWQELCQPRSPLPRAARGPDAPFGPWLAPDDWRGRG